jgi:hypothetical protein
MPDKDPKETKMERGVPTRDSVDAIIKAREEEARRIAAEIKAEEARKANKQKK